MIAATRTTPWWRSAPNPACRPWCQDQHDLAEFSIGGSLACRREVDADDWFVVEVTQITSVLLSEAPDVVEVLEATVWQHVGELTERTPSEVERYARALLAAVEFIVRSGR